MWSNFSLLMAIIPSQKKQKIINLIKTRLPHGATLIILSLTGSRAWGYSNRHSDYDIVGLYVAKNYWDSVQIYQDHCDINLYQFKNPLRDKRFYFFEDLSNPFYLHSKFDFEGFFKFCTIDIVRYYDGEILQRIRDFEINPSPRNALHAYQSLMIPVHFLQYHQFELNLFKINQSYKFQQLQKLKNAYLRKEEEVNKKEICKDLKKLLNKYKQLCYVEYKGPSMAEGQKWFERELDKFI